MEYRVLQIDAIGDGLGNWEVDNLYSLGTIELSENDLWRDESIIERLIQENYFTELARGKFHDPYDDSTSSITIAEIETGKPVFELLEIKE